jgi:hypothetical protein
VSVGHHSEHPTLCQRCTEAIQPSPSGSASKIGPPIAGNC